MGCGGSTHVPEDEGGIEVVPPQELTSEHNLRIRHVDEAMPPTTSEMREFGEFKGRVQQALENHVQVHGEEIRNITERHARLEPLSQQATAMYERKVASIMSQRQCQFQNYDEARGESARPSLSLPSSHRPLLLTSGEERQPVPHLPQNQAEARLRRFMQSPQMEVVAGVRVGARQTDERLRHLDFAEGHEPMELTGSDQGQRRLLTLDNRSIGTNSDAVNVNQVAIILVLLITLLSFIGCIIWRHFDKKVKLLKRKKKKSKASHRSRSFWLEV